MSYFTGKPPPSGGFLPKINLFNRLRLRELTDCPEKGQAYGKPAKHAASDLAFGEEVTLQTHGYDKYKRTL